MKKLIIAVAVLAIAVSFLPKAEAGETAELSLNVTFAEPPVISIELVDADGQPNTEWALDRFRLGEEKMNSCPEGWLHNVKNTGTVCIGLSMGYAELSVIGTGTLQPGPEQGVDTFVVKLGTEPILADVPLHLLSMVEPGHILPLKLTYGAPTELSGDVTGMNAVFEIRAYPYICR